MTTSLLSCAKKDGNTYSEIKKVESLELNSSFIEEITKIYQHLTGDYKYQFIPSYSPSFTPFTSTTAEINYTYSNAVGTTASIGLNDEARIIFNYITGEIEITFGRDAGTSALETFTVPWASYNTGPYTQLNDDLGNPGNPYTGTSTTVTDKIFTIDWTGKFVNIKIYENATVSNELSREITFDPIALIVNRPTDFSTFISNFMTLNQNPFYNNGGTNTLVTTRTDETFTNPFTGTSNFAGTSYTGLGYLVSYKNNYSMSSDGVITQIIVNGVLPEYFSISGSLSNLVTDMTTAPNLNFTPTNSTKLESIIRSTYTIFNNSYLAIQAGKSIDNCYEKCDFNIRIIHKEEDAECL